MENQPTIEQEIAQLEKQISEKRAALGLETPFDATQGKETEPPEKGMLHEMVGEKIQQHAPQYQPTPQAPQSTSPKSQQDLSAQAGDTALSYVLPELKDKVQELVNTVFSKSLDEGIKEASKTNNPALIDAFHDVLVDELYNVLLERKKLEQIK